MRRFSVFVMAVLAGTCAFFGAARAQLASTSPAYLGTAGNSSALARGFSAMALNPANLGLPDNLRFTMTMVPVQARAGVGPIGFGDVADYEGKMIPRSQKDEWLREIRDAGGLNADSGAEASAVCLSAGQFGFQVTSVANVRAKLNPDAAELVLYGNAGRTGSPEDYDLAGSWVDGFAATTFAASYAMPVSLDLGPPGSTFAVGMTAKYTVGHALVVARDAGSRLASDPVEVDVQFPVIAPGEDFDAVNSGTGFGLDLGAAWQSEGWTVGATLQNLVQTFKWDLKDHVYRPGEAFFNGDTSSTEFDEMSLTDAPAFLRRVVDDLGFDPKVSVAAAYQARPDLALCGEFRHQFGDGLRLEEETHLGAGGEYRPVRWLPLRAGTAVVNGGMQFAGGAGVEFGGFRVSGAVLGQTGKEGLTEAALAISYGGS
jgi:hypothetical protein